MVRLGGGVCFLLTHFPVFDSEAVCQGVASPSPDREEGRQLGAPTSAWTPEARLSSPAGKDRASQETTVCDDHGTCSGDDGAVLMLVKDICQWGFPVQLGLPRPGSHHLQVEIELPWKLVSCDDHGTHSGDDGTVLMLVICQWTTHPPPYLPRQNGWDHQLSLPNRNLS